MTQKELKKKGYMTISGTFKSIKKIQTAKPEYRRNI